MKTIFSWEGVSPSTEPNPGFRPVCLLAPGGEVPLREPDGQA